MLTVQKQERHAKHFQFILQFAHNYLMAEEILEVALNGM